MMVPGKPGLVQLKSYWSPGLPSASLTERGAPCAPLAYYSHSLRHADVDFGGEAVGQVAGGGKPARGIEQVGDGLLDGCELQAFDRAVFVTGDGAFVFECPTRGLAWRTSGEAGVMRMVPSAERSPVSTLPEASVILLTLRAGWKPKLTISEFSRRLKVTVVLAER